MYEDPIAVKDLIEEIKVIRGFNQDQLDEVVLSGLNIGGVIVKSLESLNLDLVKCVACCMDGHHPCQV